VVTTDTARQPSKADQRASATAGLQRWSERAIYLQRAIRPRPPSLVFTVAQNARINKGQIFGTLEQRLVMSRESRIARTVRRAIDRQLEKKEEEAQRRKNPFYKRLFGIIVFVLGVPGLIVGILSLFPRLSVVAQDPLDDHNPFLAPFVISNDGILSLYDLQAFCFPVYVQLIGVDGKGGQIVLRPTPGYHEEDMSTGMTSDSFVAKKLSPASKMTFPCNMILLSDFRTNLAVGRADISYVVTYQTFGISLTRHHVNHFSLSRDVNGHAHWLEEPLGQ
jgi:hypothetical protein